MSSSPVQTEALFLPDRNVVSLIKQAVAGRTPSDPKKQAYLDSLRRLDVPEHSVSPLLSIMEGEKGYEDSVSEKEACLEKETAAVGQFFKVASTDSVHLLSLKSMAAQLFAGPRGNQWQERAAFLLKAAPLVAHKVTARKRKAVDDGLVQLALAAGLSTNDPIVVFFLACLYGNDAARKVIKPKNPGVHNVLTDIHIISRVGMVKAAARQLPIPLKVRLLTHDEGLFDMLNHMRISRPHFNVAGRLQMDIRYAPELFTDLSKIDRAAMVARLHAPL